MCAVSPAFLLHLILSFSLFLCRTVAAEVRKQIAGQYGGSPQLFKNLNAGTATTNTVSFLKDWLTTKTSEFLADVHVSLNCYTPNTLGVNLVKWSGCGFVAGIKIAAVT